MAQLYSDNFNDNTLSGVWTTGSGYGDSSIDEHDGYLELTISGTDEWDDGYVNISQNNIDEYIDVRVKITDINHTVTDNSGFIYYDFGVYNNTSNDNFKFDIWYNTFGSTTSSGFNASGPYDGNYSLVQLDTPFWLRITYGGRLFQFYYSTNGSDWTKVYDEVYKLAINYDIYFECGADYQSSITVKMDDFVAAEKSADPEAQYGLEIYNNNQLQFNPDTQVKYIVYTTTVSGGDSGSTFIPVTGDRRYTCLSYAKEYGKSEHSARISDITSSGIELTWTAVSVGSSVGGTSFHGMPSGDSIIYVMGY